MMAVDASSAAIEELCKPTTGKCWRLHNFDKKERGPSKDDKDASLIQEGEEASGVSVFGYFLLRESYRKK